MRVLLDTNIIIHREASTVVKEEIGVLFNWLDRLHHSKCIHPLTITEIGKHKDRKVVATFDIKLKNYIDLKTEAPESAEIQQLRQNDKNENDANDTSLIKEVFGKRVDCLITEDRRIHEKAKLLAIGDRVFTIDDFLERVTAENPELASYKVLAVKREYFGKISLDDTFFDSFKRDYVQFAEWFNRKADEVAYTCKSEKDETLAFLYVKPEDERESYTDMAPPFVPKRRLKIGTFKVAMNGYRLGERFLKIIFDNAIRLAVDEIYVTVFNKDTDQERLIELLGDWGSVSTASNVVRRVKKWCLLETSHRLQMRLIQLQRIPIFRNGSASLLSQSIRNITPSCCPIPYFEPKPQIIIFRTARTEMQSAKFTFPVLTEKTWLLETSLFFTERLSAVPVTTLRSRPRLESLKVW